MADLVERESALAALERTFRGAASGRGAVALVTGEPGIGKTALVTDFVSSHEREARVLRGMCDDLTTPRPLGAIRDVAERVSPALVDVVAAGRPPWELHEALLQELRSIREPIIAVLEDVHWADEATVDVITVLGRRIAELRLLLVLTFRPGEVEATHPLRGAIDATLATTALHIDLPPLSREAVATLAGEDADRIMARTGGNPFFVTELLAGDRDGLPPTVAQAVLGRVSRLDDQARELLELISMVPSRIACRVLDALAPGWPSAAEQAERHQLLVSGPEEVRFRHELARAAVRSSVPPGRRRLLHRRILEALLAAESDPADLVHHAEAAGAMDVVADYALIAARRAAAVGAHREALVQYRRGAAFLDRLANADAALVWDEIARAAYLVGHLEEALEASSRAIALHQTLGDAESVGRCTQFRAHLHWTSGHGDAAWEDACAALRSLEVVPGSPLLAEAHCQLAELAMLASRIEEALRWGGRALQLAGSRVAPVRSRALATIGAARMQLDPDDVTLLLEAFEAAQAATQHHEMLLVLAALTSLNLQWARPDRAAAHAAAGSDYGRNRQVDMLTDYLDAHRAWLLLRSGDWDAAERVAASRLSRDSAAHSVVGLVARIVLAELAVRRGDDDCEERLSGVAEAAERTGDLQRIEPVLELQVEQALLRGDALPIERFGEVGQFVGAGTLGRGCLGGRFAAWATLCGAGHNFLGRAPEPHAAMLRGDWHEAAEAFAAVGWSYDQALMLSLLQDAQSLAAALGIARSLGAAPLEARIRARMSDLGMSPPRGPAASTRSNPGELTDRQLEVMELVCEGLGNAEIAERLCLSPRTVEHHVTASFTKLEVSSRAAAVSRALELGVTPGRDR